MYILYLYMYILYYICIYYIIYVIYYMLHILLILHVLRNGDDKSQTKYNPRGRKVKRRSSEVSRPVLEAAQ